MRHVLLLAVVVFSAPCSWELSATRQWWHVPVGIQKHPSGLWKGFNGLMSVETNASSHIIPELVQEARLAFAQSPSPVCRGGPSGSVQRSRTEEWGWAKGCFQELRRRKSAEVRGDQLSGSNLGGERIPLAELGRQPLCRLMNPGWVLSLRGGSNASTGPLATEDTPTTDAGSIVPANTTADAMPQHGTIKRRRRKRTSADAPRRGRAKKVRAWSAMAIFNSKNASNSTGTARQGFIEMKWIHTALRLILFRMHHGHTNVPQKYTSDPKLGHWIMNQKRKRAAAKLDDGRIAVLERLDFNWTKRFDREQYPQTGMSFHVHFPHLLLIRQQHGHLDLPSTDGSLRKFLRDMTQQRQSGKLRTRRLELLEGLGMRWRQFRRRGRHSFEERIEEMKRYIQTYGHLRVPQNGATGFPTLGRFVWHMRVLRAKGELPREKVERLEKLGFVWMVGVTEWEERYAQLCLYMQQHGHSSVPQLYHIVPRLGWWCSNQRTKAQRGRLPAYKRERLDRLDFSWHFTRVLKPRKEEVHDATDADATQDHNSSYVITMNNSRRRRRHPQQFAAAFLDPQTRNSLARTPSPSADLPRLSMSPQSSSSPGGIARRPRKRKGEKFSPGNATKILVRDFDMALQQVMWTRMVSGSASDTTRTKHEGPLIRSLCVGFILGVVNEARISMARSFGVTLDRKTALECVREKPSWETRLQELKEFRRTNGHCFVPQSSYASSTKLSRWVNNQRAMMASGCMSAVRQKRLEAAGFVWDSKQAEWELRFLELSRYAFEHGSIPNRLCQNVELWRWVQMQRLMARKGTLLEDRRLRLREVAEWVATGPKSSWYLQSWHHYFNLLLAFVQMFGHCNVQSGESDVRSVESRFRGLAVWKSAQRALTKSNQLDHKRVVLLQSVNALEASDVVDPAEGWWDGDALSPPPPKRKRASKIPIMDAMPGIEKAGEDVSGMHYAMPATQPEGDWRAAAVNPGGVHENRGVVSVRRVRNKEVVLRLNGGQPNATEDVDAKSAESFELLEAPLKHFVAQNPTPLGEVASNRTRRSKMQNIISGKWFNNWREMLRYRLIFGNSNVPQVCAGFHQLGHWVMTQRAQKRRGRLPAERLRKLNAAGFRWRMSKGKRNGVRTSRFEDEISVDTPVHKVIRCTWEWWSMFRSAMEFQQHHGNLDVPKTDAALFIWLEQHRALFFKTKVIWTSANRQMLRLGTKWLQRQPEWFRSYTELMLRRMHKGSVKLEVTRGADHRLVRWVRRQRGLRRKDLLSQEHTEKLTALGIDWGFQDSHWETMYGRLAEYRRRWGHCDVPMTFPPDPELAGWVRNQRVLHHQKLTPPARTRRLNDINFIWLKKQRNWFRMYNLLLFFHQSQGHLIVPSNWKSADLEPGSKRLKGVLWRWVRAQSQRLVEKTLDKGQVHMLGLLGLHLDGYVDPTPAAEHHWQRNFKELQAFVDEHGTTPLERKSKCWPRALSLVKWIASQRSRACKGLLTTVQHSKLASVGVTIQHRLISERKKRGRPPSKPVGFDKTAKHANAQSPDAARMLGGVQVSAGPITDAGHPEGPGLARPSGVMT